MSMMASHTHDEGIRADASLEGLAELKTITPGGVITAGNASQICDGASGVLIVSERALKEHGLTPIARIDHLTVTGGDPVIMLDEPIRATRRALERSGRSIADIDLYEVNEAFAPVPLAWVKEIGADPARLNVNGGAIALGHPLGASGAKLMATLVHALRARGNELRSPDNVRRRRHRQCDDRRSAPLSVRPNPKNAPPPPAAPPPKPPPPLPPPPPPGSLHPPSPFYENCSHRRRPGRTLFRDFDEVARRVARRASFRAQSARARRSAGAWCSATRRSKISPPTIPPSAQIIADEFAHWDDIEVHIRGETVRSSGHGFIGIGRKRLLAILGHAPASLGSSSTSSTSASPDLEHWRDYELVIGADGINSRFRDHYADSVRGRFRNPRQPLHLARHGQGVRRLHLRLRADRGGVDLGARL